MSENFEGFGKRIGFGLRPAIIVIDFIHAFTDENHLLGSNYETQLEATQQLLQRARSQCIPIIFTTVQYEKHLLDGAHFVKKIPALTALIEGSKDVEINPLLERQSTEPLIVKKFASAFFGTSLSSVLTSLNVDTLILVGCTTSGCVRATAVDSIQHGYYTIVPHECVGDRSPSAHQASLYDIQTKYGDVVSLQEVQHYFLNRQEENGDVSSSY